MKKEHYGAAIDGLQTIACIGIVLIDAYGSQ